MKQNLITFVSQFRCGPPNVSFSACWLQVRGQTHLSRTPPSNLSRAHMHARVQIQRGALPRAIWSGWISIWDASGQGINRSPQPCDEHKRAWVPLSCASALPRRRADHAVPGQGPRPNKGQWNGNPPGEPGGERPGGPGERARGGRARGRSRGMLFTPVFTGGGRVACSSPALRSARPPGRPPPRRSEHRAHAQ